MNTIANPNATSVALNEIETLAKQYADERSTVATRVQTYEDQVRATQRRFVPGIKTAAAQAAAAQARLVAAIEKHPELFAKPRTLTLHGIKLGFQKGKGKIEWDDDEKVLAAIARNYPAPVAETLIITTRTPAKDALAQLPAADLRKLGVTITDAGDFVVVKATDSEVDKLVAKILREGAVEEVAS
ncbi:MAG: host-nuclease inhibitor Gam family protein [Verrucomicrobia bacterium]|nr:host-nuclease inhibitor Gam family protein [Verrucomicrobiota bacterium]